MKSLVCCGFGVNFYSLSLSMFGLSIVSTRMMYAAILIATFVSVPIAQTVEVLEGQKQVSRILAESGKHFLEGLRTLRAHRRQESGAHFNKSVETFLLSTLNIQRDPKLQACYSALVETVYRIEFPLENHAPQLRPLAAVCDWKWTDADVKLADDVSALIAPSIRSIRPDSDTIGSIVPGSEKSAKEVSGFNSRIFEPSPLDELSKLELTPDELDVANSSGSATSRIVKARAGDTVSKLAIRHNADPTEVAKYNGLLPSSVLAAGREIRIPSDGSCYPTNSRLGGITCPSPASSAPVGDCKVNASPNIQQLRLGMTSSEVDTVLKRRSSHKKGLYAGYTYASHQGLKGLRALILRFYNSTLYDITVYYDNSIRWNGMPEFERTVAKALGLQNTWQSSSYCTVANNCRMFACSNAPFKMTVGEYGGFYSLNIWDPKIFSKMVLAESNRRVAEERKKQLEQERRKNEFKP